MPHRPPVGSKAPAGQVGAFDYAGHETAPVVQVTGAVSGEERTRAAITG